MIYNQLESFIKKAQHLSIPDKRKSILEPLMEYIQGKTSQGDTVNLNFICTHNSRRSQFSQIWAHLAAYYYHVPVNCYSGGVEVTAFNKRAVDAMKRAGFKVRSEGSSNPKYYLKYSDQSKEIIAFSKLFNDPFNDADKFAAVMTCSHADDNCPFIPGTEKRISVNYEDPKAFDETPQEAEKYDERSVQIASEMFYVFSQINKS